MSCETLSQVAITLVSQGKFLQVHKKTFQNNHDSYVSRNAHSVTQPAILLLPSLRVTKKYCGQKLFLVWLASSGSGILPVYLSTTHISQIPKSIVFSGTCRYSLSLDHRLVLTPQAL